MAHRKGSPQLREAVLVLGRLQRALPSVEAGPLGDLRKPVRWAAWVAQLLSGLVAVVASSSVGAEAQVDAAAVEEEVELEGRGNITEAAPAVELAVLAERMAGSGQDRAAYTMKVRGNQ